MPDDLISRRSAIDALEREKTYCTAFREGYTQTNVFEKYNAGLSDGIKALRNLPSAEPRWIPCSERLPEANEQDENNFDKAYLVQDARWMDVARWDGEYWVAWGYGTVLKNVTAWMPLPDPWKGETDGQH